MTDRSLAPRPESPSDDLSDRDRQRHVAADAIAWGVVTSTNNAMSGPLLLAHGAGNMVFGIYNAAISFFGLAMALFGLRLAGDRSSGGAAFRLLIAARSTLFLLPLTLVLLPVAPVEVLIAILVVWAASEGMAQPLWLGHLSSLGGSDKRGARLARRSARAAGAGLLVLVPVMVMLAVATTDAALIAAYSGAAVVGVLGLWSVHRLSRAGTASTLAGSDLRFPDGLDAAFLGAVFLFWFGAAFNRPVLPTWVSGTLGAPAAYFAAAAIAAAASGMLMQRWWGACADQHGSHAVLAFTGLAASAVPLLWLMTPVWWMGVPIEIIAAGCWLGHLLGIMLRCVEMAPTDRSRPAFIAWTQTAQGLGATIAPLAASLMAGFAGARAVLFTSGVICLIATGWLATAGSGMNVPGLARHLAQSISNGGMTPALAFDASPVIEIAPSPARSRHRSAESISLRRALFADCQSCAGLGCSTCLGTGLA